MSKTTELRAKVEEFRNFPPAAEDVFMISLGDQIKDGWVICVRNIPSKDVMRAVRDLAEKNQSDFLKG